MLEIVFYVIFELVYLFLLLFDVARILLTELYYLFLIVYDCEIHMFHFFVSLAQRLLHMCHCLVNSCHERHEESVVDLLCGGCFHG